MSSFGTVIINQTISSTDGSGNSGWVNVAPASSYREKLYIQLDPAATSGSKVLVGVKDPAIAPDPGDGTNIKTIAILSTSMAFDQESNPGNAIYLKTAGTNLNVYGFYTSKSGFIS